MPLDRYYTDKGTVDTVRTFHYAVFRGSERLRDTWFMAESQAIADGYAVQWAKKEGYSIKRKR